MQKKYILKNSIGSKSRLNLSTYQHICSIIQYFRFSSKHLSLTQTVILELFFLYVPIAIFFSCFRFLYMSIKKHFNFGTSACNLKFTLCYASELIKSQLCMYMEHYSDMNQVYPEEPTVTLV